MRKRARSESAMLDDAQRAAWNYFAHETNPANGLVLDRTSEASPASIAAVGLGLTAYPVAVERGWIARDAAAARTLIALRFFRNGRQGTEPDATGYKGFYYHFLDMHTGARAQRCELSTVDTAILLAGMQVAAAYFDRPSPPEREIRTLAEELYARVDWRWALNGGLPLSMGWKPESGFLPYRWQGYDEALVLYLLGLGAPESALSAESYAAWCETYRWKTIYGIPHIYAGPLFIHQMSYIWVDFRRIQDEYMRGRDIDYFENSRRATLIQQAYAIRNPRGFARYCSCCWGLTASDGPGPAVRRVDGVVRRFYGYKARGAPYGPDDGTIAPWAVVASLPFAPDVVLPTIEDFGHHPLLGTHRYGFKATFNPTFPDPGGSPHGWVSPRHYGINQGPIVAMIENYRSGLIWELMRGNQYLVAGLRAAGFRGGWLSNGGQPHAG